MAPSFVHPCSFIVPFHTCELPLLPETYNVSVLAVECRGVSLMVSGSAYSSIFPAYSLIAVWSPTNKKLQPSSPLTISTPAGGPYQVYLCTASRGV